MLKCKRGQVSACHTGLLEKFPSGVLILSFIFRQTSVKINEASLCFIEQSWKSQRGNINYDWRQGEFV